MTRTVVALLLGTLLAPAAYADGGSVRGSLGYSPEMAWDYNRDNKIERVQWWLDLDLETDGETVSGEAVRYLKNLDTGEKIYQLAGFDMTGNNARRPSPVTKLVIDGQNAAFTMEGVTYTVKDSDSYGPDEKPTFIAEDGFTREEMRIYDGAVTVLDR